jgi:glycosyltransferase involved in cell wall biosynthesis
VSDEYDFLISTSNELGLDSDSVDYIHYPMFSRGAIPDAPGKGTYIYSLYDWICKNISGFKEKNLSNSLLLTNSEWTASLIRSAYGIRPSVVYPPVDTEFASSGDWSERENGFVSIGRVEKSKRIIPLIDFIKELRNRGVPIHYHIVGPIDNYKYYNEVKNEISGVKYISYEGELSREDLRELLTSHKYGLHGKKHEHFGIVVAEMVEAGMIPFVPSTGGQTEIVQNISLLTFDTISDLVAQSETVLQSTETQNRIKTRLSSQSEYSVERFQKSMVQIVGEYIK